MEIGFNALVKLLEENFDPPRKEFLDNSVEFYDNLNFNFYNHAQKRLIISQL